MKDFKDYKEEIYKCSRCGLCQSVCPVFKTTLNECAVSRGKFNILNGIIKGELTFNKNVKKYLDLCTGCNACKNFCPSGIDAREIFVAAKHEYYKNTKLTFLQKILNSYFLFKILLVCAGIFGHILRFTGISRLLKLFEKTLLKSGYLGKRLYLFNSLIFKQITGKRTFSSGVKKQKAVYFDGCFNKYINNDTKSAVTHILEDSGIEIIKKDFECCGISYLNDGNIEKFKELITKNLNTLDCDCDYILTDCASCNSVLKEYKNYNETAKALEFGNKVTGVLDLIKNIKFEVISDKKYNIAVHKPCHDSYDFIDVVKNIKGINFIEIEDFDKCCGFSGKFALQNQKISRKISSQKAQHYIDANVDFIITTCPACLLGLNQGLAEINANNKPIAVNLFVFLAKYCKKQTT